MPNSPKQEIDDLTMTPPVSDRAKSTSNAYDAIQRNFVLSRAQTDNMESYESERINEQKQQQFQQRQTQITKYYDDLIQKERGSVSNLIRELAQTVIQLKDPDHQEKFIDGIQSKPLDSVDVADPTISEETKCVYLIQQIVSSAYDLGKRRSLKKAADSGRVQAKINSDNQAEELSPKIAELRANGITTLQGIADALNEEGTKTKTGHIWYPSTVKLMLKRIDSIEEQGKAQRPVNDHAKALEPILDELAQDGVTTLQGIADALNERGQTTKSGNTWYPSTVKMLLQALDRSKQPKGFQVTL